MKKVNYSKELLEEKIKDCFSFAELCRRLGLKPEGGNPKTVRKKLDQFEVDYSHFTGQGWNKFGHPSFGNTGQQMDAYFKSNSSFPSSKVRERLLNNKLKENQCEICGITNWLGNSITIQLHHINGVSDDNRIENLQMLCPNCHSQTDSYCKSFKSRSVTAVKTEMLGVSAQEETLDVEYLDIGETLTCNDDGNTEA